jgi:4-amino-4-deoxy-L-arabinose transferase-like glycosyltransferase
MQWSERTIIGTLLALVVVAQLFFGLPRLTKFSAVDEHLWTYERIPQFWNALAEGRFKKTNINDKPGISVALITGFGMLQVDPKPYESLRVEAKTAQDIALIETIHRAFRLPVYVFTLCMLPVFYFLLRKLFDSSTALFSVIFIYLSPILLGISLIINPDSLLWIFLPLAIVSFLVFQKSNQFRYAGLGGLFLGLALLTKYVSALLYVYLLLLVFARAIFFVDTTHVVGTIRKSFLGYVVAVAVSLLTVALLYPAAWVDPRIILETTFLSHPFAPIWKPFLFTLVVIALDIFMLKGLVSGSVVRILAPYRHFMIGAIYMITLSGALFVFVDTYFGMKFYDFQSMLASAQIKSAVGVLSTIALKGIATGLFVLLFSIPPIVLVLALFALGDSLRIFWKKTFTEETIILSFLVTFMLLYYVASALNNVQATVRYQIALYPIIAIIAGVGMSQILKRGVILHGIPVWGTSLVLIGLMVGSLWFIRPYYFAYASELLPKEYVVNMKDMGDGSYQAAQYLNALPNAEQMHIWSDKVAVCEYFVGKCTISLKPKHIVDIHFDYFILSNGREPKTRYFLSLRDIVVPEFVRMGTLYTSDDFEGHTIVIDDRPGNFVKVVKNVSLVGQ